MDCTTKSIRISGISRVIYHVVDASHRSAHGSIVENGFQYTRSPLPQVRNIPSKLSNGTQCGPRGSLEGERVRRDVACAQPFPNFRIRVFFYKREHAKNILAGPEQVETFHAQERPLGLPMVDVVHGVDNRVMVS